MRVALIACASGLAVLLGCVQFASMAFYGDLAQPPAIPALLSPALGSALARPLRSPRAPAFLRGAYAQAVLHRGDAAAAEAIVMQLPAGPGTADLRGQLAERRGDPAGAIEWYVRARDFERAQRLIDGYDRPAQIGQAGQLEARLVEALGNSADAGVRARALWRLGQLTQARAVVEPAAAQAFERRALGCYERALQLAPNEETYLLAAGQQALTLGDKRAALGYYQRALDAVPNSADARAGLQRAHS
jgi:tetratricopeptide (TPR) repeat protein